MGVTGQPEVMELAKKIVATCDADTDSIVLARAAIQIADTVISSRQLTAEQPLSAQVPGESSATH